VSPGEAVCRRVGLALPHPHTGVGLASTYRGVVRDPAFVSHLKTLQVAPRSAETRLVALLAATVAALAAGMSHTQPEPRSHTQTSAGAVSSIAANRTAKQLQRRRPPGSFLATSPCFVVAADAKRRFSSDDVAPWRNRFDPCIAARYSFLFLFLLAFRALVLVGGSRYRKPVEVATPPAIGMIITAGRRGWKIPLAHQGITVETKRAVTTRMASSAHHLDITSTSLPAHQISVLFCW
jgi:hypothetical protein